MEHPSLDLIANSSWFSFFEGVAKPSNDITQKKFSIEYNIQKYLEWDLICLRKTIQERDPELLDYTSYIKVRYKDFRVLAVAFWHTTWWKLPMPPDNSWDFMSHPEVKKTDPRSTPLQKDRDHRGRNAWYFSIAVPTKIYNNALHGRVVQHSLVTGSVSFH